MKSDLTQLNRIFVNIIFDCVCKSVMQLKKKDEDFKWLDRDKSKSDSHYIKSIYFLSAK